VGENPESSSLQGKTGHQANHTKDGFEMSAQLRAVKDDTGASTAEYATVTGCGVGFAAILYKFLTSEAGQEFLKMVFAAIKALLPF
jgi:hypothetical protein